MSEPRYTWWGKIPVPYTAFWTGEMPVTEWQIRRVPELAGGAFLYERHSRPGDGKPALSTFHVGRAIEVLSQQQCQICRRRLAKDDSWCICFGRRFHQRPHITDGLPMCGECTALSLRHCPTLRERAGGTLELFRVTAYTLAPAIMGPVPVEQGGTKGINDALAAWKGKRPVFGTPKVILERFSLVQPGWLLARHSAETMPTPEVAAA